MKIVEIYVDELYPYFQISETKQRREDHSSMKYIEVDDETYERWAAASSSFFEVQDELETIMREETGSK